MNFTRRRSMEMNSTGFLQKWNSRVRSSWKWDAYEFGILKSKLFVLNLWKPVQRIVDPQGWNVGVIKFNQPKKKDNLTIIENWRGCLKNYTRGSEMNYDEILNWDLGANEISFNPIQNHIHPLPRIIGIEFCVLGFK